MCLPNGSSWKCYPLAEFVEIANGKLSRSKGSREIFSAI
ncbi:hypothetical protein CKA32_003818 [Geitlerinema sp. FC II]|nr:hypothetical protein CKA32_003818 [Geitlerinema sp. FC II]